MSKCPRVGTEDKSVLNTDAHWRASANLVGGTSYLLKVLYMFEIFCIFVRNYKYIKYEVFKRFFRKGYY